MVKKIRLVHPYQGIDPAKKKAVKNEIERYKMLDHEHIVKYYGCEIIDNNIFCIYLEYMAGRSLIDQYNQIKEPTCKHYIRQVLKALEYLHREKIIHGDLKGGNVLLDKDGQNIKLCDMGNSFKINAGQSIQSVKSFINGTLAWMAPENYKSKIGRKSDIWSLGCLLIEMLTGMSPWSQKIMDSQHSAIIEL